MFAHTCSGKGAMVGFIKMGTKRLFVYDAHGNQHEIEPLCALDFYVHESRQRMGCGKRLFDHMVQVRKKSLAKVYLTCDKIAPALCFDLSKSIKHTLYVALDVYK